MDLIEEFVTLTDGIASPEQFRRWTAVSLISCMASRRVWTCIEDDMKLFANTFIFLVSPPGIGKTRAMDVARWHILKMDDPQSILALGHLHFSPDEVTRQRTIEHMGEVFHAGLDEGDATYLFFLAEFATFMPEPDPAWLQALSRMWDCPPQYEKQIKTGERKQDYVYRPYVNMLVGAQPSWFAEGFPKSSYDMGFPARTFFVYEDAKPVRELFKRRQRYKAFDTYGKNLRAVAKRSGEIAWAPEAETAYIEWMDTGQQPVVDDPLMTVYNTRRDMHAAKLALIVALAHAHKRIELSDLQQAWEMLFAVERKMPYALANAGGNQYKLAEETVLSYVNAEYARAKRPVPEYAVRRRLGRVVSTTTIPQIINELIAQGRVSTIWESQNKAPNRLLKPGRQ